MSDTEIKSLSAFVWAIADTLRGDFKQSEYVKFILPFVVLRRLDCILEEGKPVDWKECKDDITFRDTSKGSFSTKLKRASWDDALWN